MPLTQADKNVIHAFLLHHPAESRHLHSDGRMLRVTGLGGTGVVRWMGGKLEFSDVGGRFQQSVDRFIRKQFPTAFMKSTRRQTSRRDAPHRKARPTPAKPGYPPYPHGKQKIRRVMKEFESGKLRSSSGKKVTSLRQARAIALSEQRRLEGVGRDCSCTLRHTSSRRDASRKIPFSVRLTAIPKAAYEKLPVRVRKQLDEFEFFDTHRGIEARYRRYGRYGTNQKLVGLWNGRAWVRAREEFT